MALKQGFQPSLVPTFLCAIKIISIFVVYRLNKTFIGFL